MADPFPVDPPDAASETFTSALTGETSAVPHDDVQAALSDALGVPVEPVKAPEFAADAPLSGRSMSDMLTARNAEIAQAKKLAEAAALEATDPSPSTDTIRAAVGMPPRFDNQTLPRDPSVTPRTGSDITDAIGFQVTERHEPGDMPKSWMASLEQQAGENPNGGTPMPGPGPFGLRAELSQRIKRTMRAENAGLPDIEIEGLHIIAQLVAKLLKNANGDQRAIWNEMGRHCDDVAAALR